MKRKYKLPVFAVMLVLCVFTGFFAGNRAYGSGNAKDGQWLRDDAGIFSAEEEEELLLKLHEVREKDGVDTVIVTVMSTDGKSHESYADDYLDNGGYGFGSEKNAILLLIDMGEREAYISTMGAAALRSFSDYRIDEMLDDAVACLGKAEYMQCAQAFISNVDRYMNVDPNTRVREPVTVTFVLIRAGMAIGIGVIISLIVWLVLRRGTPMAVSARDYLVNGSLRITGQEDTFINKTITTRHIERSDSSSGGSGTTTHRSSSGQTHGGGGRGF